MIGTGLRADPEIKDSELIAIQYDPVCHTENLCVNQSPHSWDTFRSARGPIPIAHSA